MPPRLIAAAGALAIAVAGFGVGYLATHDGSSSASGHAAATVPTVDLSGRQATIAALDGAGTIPALRHPKTATAATTTGTGNVTSTATTTTTQPPATTTTAPPVTTNPPPATTKKTTPIKPDPQE